MLDGLTVIEINGKRASRYERWCGNLPKFAKHLRVFFEAGTVKYRKKGQPKIEDKGAVKCIFVGYALNHDGDCYRMCDPATERVHVTRDVIWMQKMYFEYPTPRTDNDEIVIEGTWANDDAEIGGNGGNENAIPAPVQAPARPAITPIGAVPNPGTAMQMPAAANN